LRRDRASRDTGALEIVRYVVMDDVGTVVNPIGLKGQIHGGVAQGLGQALMEHVVYDRESGQNLTGSFMDYCMPRADTMPYMEITSNPVPTKRNPLGAKGAGEAGTVGALPAIVNAVGPIRQIVQNNVSVQRRYLAIFPGTAGNLGAPVQVQNE